MDLSKVIIKNPEREDMNHMKDFAEAINGRDKLELSLHEQEIEFILNNDMFRKGIFIALLGDKLIGFAGCMKNISKPEMANFQVIIHPDYRRQGLGSMMYDKVLEHAKEYGVNNVTAFAKERMQESVAFAQKRGFKPEKYSWKMDLKLSDIDYRAIAMDSCTIRTVTAEDIKDYVAIMNAGFKKDGDELFSEKSFAITFNNPDGYVFFIEKDGKIAATSAVNKEKDIDRGYISNVTVYKDFRGQGLGEIAINHCINTIKEADLGKASLNVYGDNKNALNLYKKLGFVEVDTDITFRIEM